MATRLTNRGPTWHYESEHGLQQEGGELEMNLQWSNDDPPLAPPKFSLAGICHACDYSLRI